MSSLPPPPLYNSGAGAPSSATSTNSTKTSTEPDAAETDAVDYNSFKSVLGPSFALESFAPRSPKMLELKAFLEKASELPAPSTTTTTTTKNSNIINPSNVPLSKPISSNSVPTLSSSLNLPSVEESFRKEYILREVESLNNPTPPSPFTLHPHTSSLSKLTSHLHSVTSLKHSLHSSHSSITSVLTLLKSLTSSSPSTSLHYKLQDLLTSLTSLTSHYNSLKIPLQYYTNIENARVIFGVKENELLSCWSTDESGGKILKRVGRVYDDECKVHLYGERFKGVMKGLELSGRFFKKNGGVDGAEVWGLKAEYLRKVGEGMVGSDVLGRLRKAVEEVKRVKGWEEVRLEKMEGSGVYVKWVKVCGVVRGGFEILGEEGKGEVLTEYTSYRVYLLKGSLQKYMDEIQSMGVVTVVRLCVTALRRLERMERQLFESFFGSEGEQVLKDYLVRLFTIIHSCLRRLVIKEVDTTVLCSVVNILRDEVKDDEAEWAKNETLKRIGEDAQERTVFLIRRELQKDVEGYKPKPTDIKPVGTMMGVEGEQAGEDVYESWYPPLKTTLFILSRIFNVVDMLVFDDIAQVSVAACVASFQKAAALKPEKLDSQLFLIANLLTLREQLAPFALELRQVDKALHFGSAGDAIRTFVSNRSQLFDLSGNNALLNFTNNIVPKVEETEVDKKEELDGTLRRVCNGLCEEIGSKVLADSCTQPTKAKLEGALERVNSFLGGDVLASFKLYLDENTVMILMKPVQRKIVKAYQDLKVEDEELKTTVSALVEAVKKI
ncbi:hypothetical protein TrVE_jg3563 [Triparma verrucosa]|uniref:Conserved oligomeric Golgi complex subunit 3 C-terminal domain-containing protein n=1 Tax=Triparma verrucosa TaxID=1606542 RepID=A0A9W7F564_9STRA|nr:hypothetical protein TrVE_jg3563 [Triparma verrucosa]